MAYRDAVFHVEIAGMSVSNLAIMRIWAANNHRQFPSYHSPITYHARCEFLNSSMTSMTGISHTPKSLARITADFHPYPQVNYSISAAGLLNSSMISIFLRMAAFPSPGNDRVANVDITQSRVPPDSVPQPVVRPVDLAQQRPVMGRLYRRQFLHQNLHVALTGPAIHASKRLAQLVDINAIFGSAGSVFLHKCRHRLRPNPPSSYRSPRRIDPGCILDDLLLGPFWPRLERLDRAREVLLPCGAVYPRQQLSEPRACPIDCLEGFDATHDGERAVGAMGRRMGESFCHAMFEMGERKATERCL
jgi:hypothetical protein